MCMYFNCTITEYKQRYGEEWSTQRGATLKNRTNNILCSEVTAAAAAPPRTKQTKCLLLRQTWSTKLLNPPPSMTTCWLPGSSADWCAGNPQQRGKWVKASLLKTDYLLLVPSAKYSLAKDSPGIKYSTASNSIFFILSFSKCSNKYKTCLCHM